MDGEVGCEIVRITAPTVKDAANLQTSWPAAPTRASTVPIVADIHFKPEAAIDAAEWVEKVRINPGNLRGFEEVRGQGVHRRGIRRRSSTRIGNASPRWCLCQERGRAHAHRHESRLAFAIAS